MYRNGIRKYLFRACCAVFPLVVTPIGTGLSANQQAASNDLVFEVATVKPVMKDASHPFNPRHFGPHVSPAGASYWSMTIGNLIEYAYGVEPNQVTGPEWTTADFFDIEARFPEGVDKKEDRRMLQALLKDRFKLAFHTEKRELEVYALIVGKHGERLTRSLPDPVAPETDVPSTPQHNDAGEGQAKTEITKNPDGSTTLNMGKNGTQTLKYDRENSAMRFELSKMTMEELAAKLSICLGMGFHKVVDETGIRGNYKVAYDCPQPRPQPPLAAGAAGTLPSDPDGSFVLTRSLDAIGLQLEKRKMPMDVYVIDHVERPSEN